MLRESYKKSLKFLNCYAMNLSNEDLKIKVHYWGARSDHYDKPIHKHSYPEVCYVLDGEGSYIEEKAVQITLKKGIFFYSRPHVLHQIQSSKGLFILFVSFEFETMSNVLYRNFTNTNKISLSESEAEEISLVWKALYLQTSREHIISIPAVESLAFGLIVLFLLHFTDATHYPPQKYSLHRHSSNLVKEAISFTRDNISQQLTLEFVASYFHISGRHLSRLFYKELGISFVSFVRKERILQSKHLLTSTDMLIKGIAEAMGYPSVHHFTKVFKKEVGETPGKFRSQLGV